MDDSDGSADGFCVACSTINLFAHTLPNLSPNKQLNMADKQIFYINDIEIDLSRSVLVKDGETIAIEPKVLQVLSLLAQRQNSVVAHKDIMEQVWQGAEVVPSALQRCIAILRKELGDNAKSPTIIATHPKIGYRLLAEVTWQPAPEDTNILANEPGESNKPRRYLSVSLLTVVVLVAIVSLLWNQMNSDAGSFPEKFTQIKPLTRTDAHESHPVFSPNAEYMVFNRYAGSCKSHLWARHLDSGKESRLTALPGDFGGVSFTHEGRELVFAANFKCDEADQVSIKQNLSNQNVQVEAASQSQSKSKSNEVENSQQANCWSLATLDFSLSLTTPQTPKFRHHCEAERLTKPVALPNHQYAFLQYENDRYQLMHYNDLDKTVRPFYVSQSLFIYHFDYDPIKKRFAVFSRDQAFNNVLEILDETAKVIGRKTIQLLPGMSRYQLFRGNFEPGGEYLLAVTNNRLYKISLNGKMEFVRTPTPDLISAVKHPTNNALLAVQGQKDVDVVQLSLTKQATPQVEFDLNSVTLPFPSFARTSAQEEYALYQPYGDSLAFISNRSGSDQIWVWQNNSASQLSSLAHQSSIESFAWSPDGKRLAWSVGENLVLSDLEGKIQLVETSKPIFAVLSWYDDDQLLVLLNDPEPGGLYKLDISQNKPTAFGINQVEKAWVVQGKLIFKNLKGEVFNRSLDSSEDDVAREFTKIIERGKDMFVAGDFIYNVDEKFMLNQHDLNGELIKPVMQLKKMAWKVSDLKDEQLLLTQFVSISNDIVILE